MTQIKIYGEPPVNIKEIVRYAGGGDESIIPLVRECLEEIKNMLIYKVCFAEMPVDVSENIVDFGFAQVFSKDLSKNLSLCKKAVVFAATVGFAPDRLSTKYSVVSPAKALVFQAIGNERVEALCDVFCDEYKNTKPRFSPGYGDLPLEFQKEIFRLLDCRAKIGLALSESLIMSPSKSVTAVVGLK